MVKIKCFPHRKSVFMSYKVIIVIIKLNPQVCISHFGQSKMAKYLFFYKTTTKWIRFLFKLWRCCKFNHYTLYHNCTISHFAYVTFYRKWKKIPFIITNLPSISRFRICCVKRRPKPRNSEFLHTCGGIHVHSVWSFWYDLNRPKLCSKQLHV